MNLDADGAAAPISNGPETAERATGGRFAPGNPGGPGRPKGTRHKALLALEAIGSEAAEAVLRQVVEEAKGGDLRAAEILLRRLWPERKGRPIEFELPPMASAADLVSALAAVAGAMGRGELTPEEAQSAAGVLETQRKAIETAELERRIAVLEECTAGLPGAKRSGGHWTSGWGGCWSGWTGLAFRSVRSKAGRKPIFIASSA